MFKAVREVNIGECTANQALKKQPLAWYLEDKKDSSRAEFFVTAFVFEPRAHTGWRPCLQFAYHGLLYDAPFACYFAIAGGLDSEHLWYSLATAYCDPQGYPHGMSWHVRAQRLGLFGRLWLDPLGRWRACLCWLGCKKAALGYRPGLMPASAPKTLVVCTVACVCPVHGLAVPWPKQMAENLVSCWKAMGQRSRVSLLALVVWSIPQ